MATATLDDLRGILLRDVESLTGKRAAERPLWPAPYDELTPEAAYWWLTECWWTENEANRKVELVPKKEYVRRYCEEWVRSFLARRPMFTEKSRRLVISWASRGLETWVMGLERGTVLIVDQTDENAGEHLWRVHYCLQNLYDRRPDFGLRRHEVRGAVLTHNVSDVILPNGSWLSQTHQEAGKSQGKGKTIVTLEELSKYQSPTAFVGQALIVTQGEAGIPGGWVNGICNASPNPDWHQIKANGKDPSGKPRHVKAAELLMEPAALLMTGFAACDLPDGYRYLAMHYTADDDKRGGWRVEGVPPREWDREYELNEDVHAGKPVYETYIDDRHCPKTFRGENRIPVIAGSKYFCSIDGGSTMRPAAVLFQVTRGFQVHLLLEVTSDGNEPMTLFAPRVLKEVQRVLPGAWPDVVYVGDGTIRNRMGNNGKSAADYAKPILSQMIKPMDNSLATCQSAVTSLLMDEMAGKGDNPPPRFIIDGACTMVRSGFNGAYKFEPLVLSDGSTTYKDKPMKNAVADPMNAVEYGAQAVWKWIEGASHGAIHPRKR